MNLNNRLIKPRVSLSTDKLPVARRKETEDPDGESHSESNPPGPSKGPALVRPSGGMFRTPPSSTSRRKGAESLVEDEETFLRMLHLLNLAVSEQNGTSLSGSTSKLVCKVRREAHTARLVAQQPLSISVFQDGVLLEDRNGVDSEQLILTELERSTCEYATPPSRFVFSRSQEGVSQYWFHGTEARSRLLNDISLGYLPSFLSSAYENGVKVEGKWFEDRPCHCVTQSPQSIESRRREPAAKNGHRLGGIVRNPTERVLVLTRPLDRPHDEVGSCSLASETVSKPNDPDHTGKAVTLLAPKGRLVLQLPCLGKNWLLGSDPVLPADATVEQFKEWLCHAGHTDRNRVVLEVAGKRSWDVSGAVRDSVRTGIVVRCSHA